MKQTALRSRSGLVRLAVIAISVTALAVAANGDAARADEADGSSEPALFPDVGRVDVDRDPEAITDFSGWLILSPSTRRGYALTEVRSPTRTAIQSFDLDTLQPLQRVVVPGLPVTGGAGTISEGSANYSGDVAHAVDPVSRRVYMAFSDGIVTGGNTQLGVDWRRRALRFVVLDERQFDVDPKHAFGGFTFPVRQSRLLEYGLMGMRVTREHVHPGVPGKLVAVFASVYPMTSLPPASTPIPGPFDHTLVQWDVSQVPTGQAAPAVAVTNVGPLDDLAVDWEQVLYACGTSSMTSQGTSEAVAVGMKNYQWAVLPTKTAIYLGCQSAPMSGAVVRVAVNPDTGHPEAGLNQQLTALGKPIGDTLVDPGGGRMYLKSFGGDGVTWWAFETSTMRFSGSIAVGLVNGQLTAAGIDEGSGRLYTHTADFCVPRAGGGSLAIRGGLKIADARLDPVPAAQSVRPDLAYPSVYRIHVDPVTRRVFVRRGNPLVRLQAVYPGCRQDNEAPPEPFYRVLQDNVPVAQKPAELDDAAFTTNVTEKEGVTHASFLGSGSGFGARVLLTGGLDAVARGAPTTAGSPCGRDDRELLVGSVGNVEVSDQSARAESASLDADARTREAMGQPATRCRSQAPPPAEPLNKCHADIHELAFDDVYGDGQGQTKDDNGDGCPDRSGVNQYAAECVGDLPKVTAGGPSGSRVPSAVARPRHGFSAEVSCEAAKQEGKADARGSLASERIEKFQSEHKASVPQDPVRVAHAATHVSVTRRLGKGVTVTVDSIARGIELPGLGTIGVVRAEASSTATGRDARAGGTYKRTICDVRVAHVVLSGCTGDEMQQAFLAKQLNDVLSGRGEVRLRHPDEALLVGTEHGYLAAVQRDRKELFGDQTITRDISLAIPGMEIQFFFGDGGSWGAGRQVFQLAGVQAATSYGIVCAFGQRPDGKCADADDGAIPPPDDGGTYDGGANGGGVPDDRMVDAEGEDSDDESTVIRVLRKIPAAVAEALRLLFNNPRELALMATVWALLYGPCYLGERRRTISGLRARRASIGGSS